MLPLPILKRRLTLLPSISPLGRSLPSSSCSSLCPSSCGVKSFLFFFPTISIASLRKSVGLTTLFFLLTVTFMVLAIGECGLPVQNEPSSFVRANRRFPEERYHPQDRWWCRHRNRSCCLLL